VSHADTRVQSGFRGVLESTILGFRATVFFASDKVCKGWLEGIFGISGWLSGFGDEVGFDWNRSVISARKISFRILWYNIFFCQDEFYYKPKN
jgi:hypothetical protein